MSKQRSSRGARAVRAVAVAVAAVAVAVAVVAMVRSGDSEPDAEEPAAIETVAVTTGDLTTSEELDGTVETSASTTVLHRIEGESASTSAGAVEGSGAASTGEDSTGGSADGSSSGSASVMGASISQVGLIDEPAVDPCTTAADPAVPESMTTTMPAGTTTTTLPAEPTTAVPGEPTATSTTTVPDGTAGTTVPPDTTVAPSTTVECVTTTTDAIPAPSTGGAPTGGGSRPSGAAETGGSAPSAAATTSRTTEVVTSVAAAGTEVRLGDVLYTVDGRPVVVMSGSLPAWRTLSTASDDGSDVLQLEQSLVALGYDPDGEMTVDEEFDTNTENAVEAWQTGLGIEATGEVPLGSVVFLSSSATVSTVHTATGDSVGEGDAVLTVSAPSQLVVIDVPDEAQQFVVPGLPVDLDGIQGTVTRLRSIESDSGVGVQAVITPTEPLGVVDGTTVGVEITVTEASDALLAPADAVASRLDGSYAVQVQQADGRAAWTPVEVLGVSGSRVGIRGNGIVEGALVLVPA